MTPLRFPCPPRPHIRVQSVSIRGQIQLHRPNNIIGDGVWGHPLRIGSLMLRSPKFSLVRIVLFAAASDRRLKKMELLLSCASGDPGLAVVTTRRPRLRFFLKQRFIGFH
jgi:hypothetical protein